MSIYLFISDVIIKLNILRENGCSFNNKFYKKFRLKEYGNHECLTIIITFFQSPKLNKRDYFKDFSIKSIDLVSNKLNTIKNDELVYQKRRRLHVYNFEQQKIEFFAFENRNLNNLIDAKLFISLASFLSFHSSILIHGAGFSINCQGYIASGVSGAGKSTFWQLLKPDFLLSDDVVAVTHINEVPKVHATPIGGMTDGERVEELKAIFFLNKNNSFKVKLLNPREAFIRFWEEQLPELSRLFPKVIPFVFKNARLLFDKIPAYEISFSKDYIDREIMDNLFHRLS